MKYPHEWLPTTPLKPIDDGINIVQDAGKNAKNMVKEVINNGVKLVKDVMDGGMKVADDVVDGVQKGMDEGFNASKKLLGNIPKP